MISIQRQGLNGTAVLQVELTDLTRFAPLASFVDSDAETKAVAKRAAVATMVSLGWTGKVTATRATLSADGKFYSVSLKHILPRTK